MRRPVVAGNWKMYGTKTFVAELLLQIKTGIAELDLNKMELLIFPPYVFLEQAKQILSDSKIQWGGQNYYPANEGAFTGEISPLMLTELDCHYVIIGHSERRQLFNETEEMISKKLISAGKFGLKPVLCIGETYDQRNAGEAFTVIKQQLHYLLNNAEGITALANTIIAYEPVWAIGTGVTASPDQAQEMHYFIRQQIAKIDKALAEKTRILYGGSVKSTTAAALFAMPDIDGGLIGGASLNAKEFLEIAKLCN